MHIVEDVLEIISTQAMWIKVVINHAITSKTFPKDLRFALFIELFISSEDELSRL